MQVSYSRVDCFKKCPFKYKLRYIDRYDTLPDDESTNPLYLGTALHTCLQVSIEAGIKQYFSFYHVITDSIIGEALKLELLAQKARKLVPPNGRAEVPITNSDFVGYIDWLTDDGDLYDFKYCSSSSADKYKDSEQLHLYKHFYTGEIKRLFYLIVPKCGIRQKKTETLDQYRMRIKSECEKLEPYLMEIKFDANFVSKFLIDTKRLLECESFAKNSTNLCRWCEYQKFCEEGDTTMLLPKNERRTVTAKKDFKKVWIYGVPFSGKTVFANGFPEPLMLNTDGNTKYVDAPYITIKDTLTGEGRLQTRVYAWQIFKEAIDELEKGENTYKTIVVDLLEDTYEQCRLYMYNKLGITHESDDSFRAWDKIRTEWLSTLKRLLMLDYNIVLISHEDSSRDLTKKTGDKVSSIKPNLNEKMSNKIAGMVDIVARVVADGDERVLSFKNSDTIFGGGRINVAGKDIPLNYKSFAAIYGDTEQTKPAEEPTVDTSAAETVSTAESAEQLEAVEEKPARRTRRVRPAE